MEGYMNLGKKIIGILVILMAMSLVISCSGKKAKESEKVVIDFWHLDSNDMHHPEWTRIAEEFHGNESQCRNKNYRP